MSPSTSSGVAGEKNGWLARVLGSAVIWSWLFSGLRLASGLILVPLLWRLLSRNDFGMYYVLVQLGTVVPMMDFGFSLSVERSLAYARGGATSLESIGVGTAGGGGEPNRALMAEIVHSSKRLYRWLSIGSFVLLGVVGTYSVGLSVEKTSDASLTWLAWGIYLVSLSLDLYTSYWVAVMRGLNRVTDSARWLSIAYGVRLGLAALLLLGGAGLLAVPLASLVSGILLRAGVGRAVRSLTGADPGVTEAGVRRILRVLWPNSWRLGVQLMALFLASYAYSVIVQKQLGPAVYGEYGFSLQIMNIAVGVAAVWVTVKWPVVAKLRIEGSIGVIRRLMRPRFWLQNITYLVLAGGAVSLGPWLPILLHTDKQMLSRELLILMALNSFGELNFAFWTTLISTENRIPALWGLIATQLAGTGVVAWLVLRGGHGIEAVVIVPLILGCLFNYWWWGREGAKMLGTTLSQFLFQRTHSDHAETRIQARVS